MGLIIEAPLPVVTRTRIHTDGSSSSTVDDTSSFDETIYRVFNMRDDMITLTLSNRPKNEFELFVEYADKKTNSKEYNDKFDSLDEYLGSIGVLNG